MNRIITIMVAAAFVLVCCEAAPAAVITVNGATVFDANGFEDDAPALPRHVPSATTAGSWVVTRQGAGVVEVYDATSDPVPGPNQGEAYCVLYTNPTPGPPWEYGMVDAEFSAPTTTGDVIHAEYDLRIDGLYSTEQRAAASYPYSSSFTTVTGEYGRWWPNAKTCWGVDFQEGKVATYDYITTTDIEADEMIVFFLDAEYRNVTTAGGTENMYMKYNQWYSIEMDYVDDADTWTLTIDGVTSDPLTATPSMAGWSTAGVPIVSLDMAASAQDGVGIAYIDGTGEGAPPIPGDINNDGVVNGGDATILAANWQSGPDATAAQGDINGDGYVDDIDATILAGNWQTGASSATVPEPSMLVLLICACAAMSAWKKRLV